MKAADLFAGQIDRDAPTTSPVQPIATALQITEVALDTEFHGKKMVRLAAGALEFSCHCRSTSRSG